VGSKKAWKTAAIIGFHAKNVKKSLILKKKIILASTSRYRAELLSRLKLAFGVESPSADEAPLAGETPAATALRLAEAKARNVAALRHGQAAVVIGSDQVADLDGQQIGKPGTRERAREQLRAMRAKTVIFHTAVAVIDCANGEMQSEVVATNVTFRDYSDAEIENYLDRENALDCAGSAKSEGLGAALILRMRSDDPTALIGLPLLALHRMLANAGIEVLS
jgi:septum formation protein